MNDRGGYSPIARALRDGPDFQRLSPIARHVFYDLKIGFGPTGLEIHYPDAFVSQLVHTTGWTPAQIRRVLDELEEGGWIAREENLVWIVGQLEFHAHMNPTNALHRKGVQKHLAGLPRLSIVRAFIDHYIAYFAGLTDPSKGYPMAIDSPSKHEVGSRKKEIGNREKEEHSRETAASGRNGGKSPRPSWLDPIRAAWEARSGAGSFASIAGQSAKVLQPLVRAGHDPPMIATHLAVYLERTDPQFASITRFAQTYEQWAPTPIVDEQGFLTPDAYDRLSR